MKEHNLDALTRLIRCAEVAYRDAGIPMEELRAVVNDVDKEMDGILADVRIVIGARQTHEHHDAAKRLAPLAFAEPTGRNPRRSKT